MIKAIVFDFDGTLIDSRPITTAYYQETMRHFNQPVPTEKTLDRFWGMKSRDTINSLLHGKTEDFIEEVYRYNRKLALENALKIPLKEGVIETLMNLSEKYVLALATNRGKKTLRMILKKYKLDRIFKTVIDREDVKNHKPHPESILKTIEKLKIDKNESIYVGDTKIDVECSHNASIPCIIINEFKESYGSDYLITKIEELPQLIDKIDQTKL